jgi:hypothetical protein
MDHHAIAGTPSTKAVLYGALELSKNTWLLALQLPDRAQPSLYPIRGGDTEGLMAKLTAAGEARRTGHAPAGSYGRTIPSGCGHSIHTMFF